MHHLHVKEKRNRAKKSCHELINPSMHHLHVKEKRNRAKKSCHELINQSMNHLHVKEKRNRAKKSCHELINQSMHHLHIKEKRNRAKKNGWMRLFAPAKILSWMQYSIHRRSHLHKFCRAISGGRVHDHGPEPRLGHAPGIHVG